MTSHGQVAKWSWWIRAPSVEATAPRPPAASTEQRPRPKRPRRPGGRGGWGWHPKDGGDARPRTGLWSGKNKRGLVVRNSKRRWEVPGDLRVSVSNSLCASSSAGPCFPFPKASHEAICSWLPTSVNCQHVQERQHPTPPHPTPKHHQRNMYMHVNIPPHPWTSR